MRTPLFIFALIAVAYVPVVLLFPQKLQTIESYAYAMGVDGYYDLSSTFRAALAGSELPDFSRYHPNHPVMHWLAGVLHDHFGLSGFHVLRYFNIAGAIFCLGFLYLSALRLWKSAAFSCAITACCAFSFAFWSAALSAEVHLPALGFLVAAAYFLMLYLDSEDDGRSRHLFYAAAFFVCAVAFHLYAVFSIVPAALALLLDSKSRKRWRVLLAVGLFIFTGLLVFYGVFLVGALHISSLKQYLDVMLMYARLEHVRYHGVEWYSVLLQTGLYAFVGGFSPLAAAVKICIGISVLLGQVFFARANFAKSIRVFIVGWPVTYVALNIVASGRADGINGWIFLLPPLCLGCGALFRQDAKMYLFILPALLAIFNLFFAILPANAPRKKDVVYLADPAAQMQKPNLQLPVAFAVADPVLTYAEMWQMGSVYGFRNQTLFLFCCGEVNGAAKLRKWMAGQGSFFLVSDALDDRLDKILIDERIKFSSIQEAAGEIQHAWMPSSIYFSRPADYHVRKKLKVFFVERTGAGS